MQEASEEVVASRVDEDGGWRDEQRAGRFTSSGKCPSSCFEQLRWYTTLVPPARSPVRRSFGGWVCPNSYHIYEEAHGRLKMMKWENFSRPVKNGVSFRYNYFYIFGRSLGFLASSCLGLLLFLLICLLAQWVFHFNWYCIESCKQFFSGFLRRKGLG